MTGSKTKDIMVLRDLAMKTMEIAKRDIQNERRELWGDFHSMLTYKVPVYILDVQSMWREVFNQNDLVCEDPLFRIYENWFQLELYHSTFGDDHITEPWVCVRPIYEDGDSYIQKRTHWGIEISRERYADTLAMRYDDPFINTLEDIKKITTPSIKIDETKTKERFDIIQDAIGDIIDVQTDNSPDWLCGISAMLGYMFNPQNLMMQFYDQPDLVHKVAKLISDEAIKLYDEYEKRGYLTNNDKTFLTFPQLQAPTYSRELISPGTQQKASLKQLWNRGSAQEFEGVSPAFFDEYVMTYNAPILEKFGLSAFGCCENLTEMIKYIKRIKNLRRIAVTPWADDEECAKQIEDKYIISWRPNPAEMVANGLNADRITKIIKNAKKIFNEYKCHWEINLKDFITVEHDKSRLKNWVDIVRNALE